VIRLSQKEQAEQSWQWENRSASDVASAKIVDFWICLNWMRKDLDIGCKIAKSNGKYLAVTALVGQFYADVQKRGGSRWDTSSLTSSTAIKIILS